MTNVFSKLSNQNESSNKQNEEWEPLNVKQHGPEFEKYARENYEANNHLEIRNKITKRILKVKSNNQVLIYAGGTRKMLRLFPLVYYAFNSSEAPKTKAENEKYVVVLKNKDDNNHLDNLERLTKSDNARKTNVRTKGNRKYRVYKRVQIIDVKEGNDKTLKGKEYESGPTAEKILGLPKGSVKNSCNRGDFAGGKFKFAYSIQELLPDEIFKEYKGIEVSNKGRVKLSNGKITRGYPIPDTRYHSVNVKLEGDTKVKHYHVHILIWQAFNGREVAKGFVICHNESIDEEERLICGYERNWSTDLREGTQRENIQEYQDKRTDLTPVLHEQSQRWYQCGNKAAKALGLDGGHVSKVCKGRCTHTGGQRFRFAKEFEKDILYAAVANGTFKWGDVWVNPGGSDNVIKDVINNIIDAVIKNETQNETEELTDYVSDEDETSEYNKRKIENKSIKIVKKVKKYI